MTAIISKVDSLGSPKFYKGVSPDDLDAPNGFYNADNGEERMPHRADGRPSNADFLPEGLILEQQANEEHKMKEPSTKTPGATFGNSTKPKAGLKSNLNQGSMPRAKAPAPGNNLK